MQQTDEHHDDEKYAQISTRRPLLRIPLAEACTAPPSTERGNTMTAHPPFGVTDASLVMSSAHVGGQLIHLSAAVRRGGSVFWGGALGGVSREGVKVAKGV